MEGMARGVTDAVGRRLSRRGFMAICGKLTLALGLAMLGVNRQPYTARAQSYCCTYGVGWCTDGAPADCPPNPSCPGGCWQIGPPTSCCYGGRVVQCYECICDGVACHCGYATSTPC